MVMRILGFKVLFLTVFWLLFVFGGCRRKPFEPTGSAGVDSNEGSKCITNNHEKRTFRVAAVQAVSKFGEPRANRQHLAELVRKAAKGGAKVVVLPETAVQGYAGWDIKNVWQIEGWEVTRGLSGRCPEDVAEPVPGVSTEYFGQLAGELEIYLTVPLLEVDSGGGFFYNSLVLMGPQGDLLAHYRKKNPWPYAERGWASPGDLGNVYVDTPFGRMGLLVCYDINFEPDNLRQQGVDHLLYAVAWVDDSSSDWYTRQLPAIAKANDMNIIGANWTLPEASEPDWFGYGQSLVINKAGKVLAKVKNDIGEEIVFADLPVEDIPYKGRKLAPGKM